MECMVQEEMELDFICVHQKGLSGMPLYVELKPAA